MVHNVPNHVFGKHANCSDDCPYKNGTTDKTVPNNTAAWERVEKDFVSFFNSDTVEKIRLGSGTQQCESFHGVVTHFAPKDWHYSSTRDYGLRVNLAILKYNEKTSYLSQVSHHLIHPV